MKTECPHCGQHYDIDDEAAGHEVTCQKCGQSFVVSDSAASKENDLSNYQERINNISAEHGDILNRCRLCGKKVDPEAKFCSNCGALTSSPEHVIPKTVKCQNCHQEVPSGSFCQNCGSTLLNLQKNNLIICSDCGREVFAFASTCPGCGRPLVPKIKAFMNEYHQIYNLSGWVSLILSVICLINGGIIGLFFGIFLFSISFFIFYKGTTLTCYNCGYKGASAIASGPNGCILILLLLVGIIPGLIYAIAVPTKRKCPQCGALAK